MLNNLKFSTLFMIFVLILSCNHSPRVKESKKISDRTSVTPIDTITDDLVSYISGMPNNKKGCLSKLDSMAKWNHYARDIDNMFSHANSFRFKKMKTWADSEFVKSPTITTLFYPFSGPDF